MAQTSPNRTFYKNKLLFQYNYSRLYVLWFLRWLLFGTITGIVCGIIGTLFHICMDWATATRQTYDILLWCLPWIGLCIVFCYHKAGFQRDPGTNLVLRSIQSQQHIPIRMAPLIFFSTVVTHLCGGSSGREGAALQIGGSIGEALGHLFRLHDTDIHIIILCGMSAVFASLFGTPIAAAVFSMEVITVGVMHYSAFVPCIVSSSIAYGITQKYGVINTLYPQIFIPEFSIYLFLKVILLSIFCGLISIIFCISMHQSGSFFQKYFPNDYGRIFTGGCLIAALTFFLGTRAYNGQGTEMIQLAFTGTCPTFAFLFKILFTAITLGTGFKGGEIVPSLFVGATFGNIIAPFLGLDPILGAAIGFIALFCGVVNCPLAALLLSVELFGHQALLLFCIVCAVSYVFSGYYGLYSSQKIMYDKLHPKYINTNSL